MRGGGGGDRLEEGMKVEANYKGKGRYFKGKIARDNRDGTYDISYDDGDREFGKRADEIRSLEGGGEERELTSTSRFEGTTSVRSSGRSSSGLGVSTSRFDERGLAPSRPSGGGMGGRPGMRGRGSGARTP